MRPVKQTEVWNCVQACIASIFELEMTDLPTILASRWLEQVMAWAETVGLGVLLFSMAAGCDRGKDFPKGWAIGGVGSPSDENPFMHAVVCWNGFIVWDPLLGEQPGTEDAKDYVVFYPLNPVEWYQPRSWQASACRGVAERLPSHYRRLLPDSDAADGESCAISTRYT